MILKMKICAGCTQSKAIWKNHEGSRYCRDCWYRLKDKLEVPQNKLHYPKVSNQNRPKTVSDKQAVLLRAYHSLRKLFFSKPEHQFCKARLLQCTANATDIHHTKGRGPWLMAMETWLPVCRTCHTYIENNPEEARVLGFTKSRVETNKNAI